MPSSDLRGKAFSPFQRIKLAPDWLETKQLAAEEDRYHGNRGPHPWTVAGHSSAETSVRDPMPPSQSPQDLSFTITPPTICQMSSNDDIIGHLSVDTDRNRTADHYARCCILTDQ